MGEKRDGERGRGKNRVGECEREVKTGKERERER